MGSGVPRASEPRLLPSQAERGRGLSPQLCSKWLRGCGRGFAPIRPQLSRKGVEIAFNYRAEGAGRMHRGAPCPGRQGAQGWEDSGARRDPGRAGVLGGGVWGGVLASLPLALSLLLRAQPPPSRLPVSPHLPCRGLRCAAEPGGPGWGWLDRPRRLPVLVLADQLPLQPLAGREVMFRLLPVSQGPEGFNRPGRPRARATSLLPATLPP